MNFQFYIEKLFDSKEFEEFIKENKDCFPCSAFITRDFENLKDAKHDFHIDYFVPSINKAFSFKLGNGVEKVPIENFQGIPNQIKINYDFDIEEIEDLILSEVSSRGIKEKIQKMLFSMQNLDNKDYLIGTVFLSGMGLLKINIDIDEKKITQFEKRSFLDIINIFKKSD